LTHQREQHQSGADQRFHHHQRCAGSGRGPRTMPARKPPRHVVPQGEGRDQREARRDAVREFDGCFEALRKMGDLTVAGRPMLPAARTRSGDAHERTKQDDEHRICEDEPGKHHEAGKFSLCAIAHDVKRENEIRFARAARASTRSIHVPEFFGLFRSTRRERLLKIPHRQ
jgi:hypothetical protein